MIRATHATEAKVPVDHEDGDEHERLYEVCALCHLFVEVSTDEAGQVTVEHLHRGDAQDEALDATHAAQPSGVKHSLDWWMEHGPAAMKARFILAEQESLDAVREMPDPVDDLLDLLADIAQSPDYRDAEARIAAMSDALRQAGRLR